MDVPPPSLLSIIYTLNAPVSHACLVGEVRVGVVDHDCCNKREVFVERFLVDARVWVLMEAIIPAGLLP